MLRSLAVVVLPSLLASASCVWLEPVPSGPGVEAKHAQDRQADDARQGKREALARAVEVAVATRDVAQAEKAVRMTELALGGDVQQELATSRAELLAAARPAAELLLASDRCAHVVTVGDLHQRGEDLAAAAGLYVEGARDCRSAKAAVKAGWALERLERCGEVVPLMREAWGYTDDEHRIAILDNVSACSNTATLRRNLSFVDDDVLADYLALQRVRACKQDCSRAYSNCVSRCGYGQYCEASCGAIADTCQAGCH